VVVLSQVLVADANLGYEGIDNTMVKACNGVPVTSLLQLAELVEESKEAYITLDLNGSELVVVDAKVRDKIEKRRRPGVGWSTVLLIALGSWGKHRGDPTGWCLGSDIRVSKVGCAGFSVRVCGL
jgi:hypothetical protein